MHKYHRFPGTLELNIRPILSSILIGLILLPALWVAFPGPLHAYRVLWSSNPTVKSLSTLLAPDSLIPVSTSILGNCSSPVSPLDTHRFDLEDLFIAISVDHMGCLKFGLSSPLPRPDTIEVVS
jgi:hypothetical protein